MVDEVYLELLFDRPFRSAFHLGEHFVVNQQLDQGLRAVGLRAGGFWPR